MFNITVLAMGKLKEKFYIQAVEEYAKRLGGFCKFQLLELPEYRLPEDPSPAQIAEGLAREGQLIREKIPKGAWFCVLTPEGKALSSEDFARTLAEVKNAGRSAACFLLGRSRIIWPASCCWSSYTGRRVFRWEADTTSELRRSRFRLRRFGLFALF